MAFPKTPNGQEYADTLYYDVQGGYEVDKPDPACYADSEEDEIEVIVYKAVGMVTLTKQPYRYTEKPLAKAKGK